MNEIDNLNSTLGLKWTTQRYQFSTSKKKNSSNIQKLNDKKQINKSKNLSTCAIKNEGEKYQK